MKVDLIVCGRFHFHKYLRFLFQRGVLNYFIYSYKKAYDFQVPRENLKNFYAKEYFMYLGAKALRGNKFYSFLIFLHRLWQWQVNSFSSHPDIAHFLIHGNCDRIIQKYKAQHTKVIGEVVNAHPHLQEQILRKEYARYGLAYESGEKLFREKIIREYSLCDYLLVPSGFIKKSLVQQGLEAGKILVLPYGIEKPAVKKAGSKIYDGKPIKIICVSQLTFRKGIVYLAEAVTSLNQSGISCELTLVGKLDPAYAPVLNPFLTDPNIHHISHVPNDQIFSKMLEQDLLVMPSLEDGFGIVVSEAISVHLPVIVTENCGAAEIILEGKNGWVVKAFSARAISEKIRESIHYDFDFSASVPDWVDYSRGLVKIYEGILPEKISP